jgi:molecular chaperone GrpE (heat shock protein)
MDNNIEHNCEFIVEVLARLEVVMLPVGSGKLDKHTQRAVAVEIAEDPDDDGLILRSVKRGFTWKDRVVRAEEVIIKKWKEGFLVALGSASSQK